jgi:hypothetical protein
MSGFFAFKTLTLNRRVTYTGTLQPRPQYSRHLRATFEKFLTSLLACARYRLQLSLLFLSSRSAVGPFQANLSNKKALASRCSLKHRKPSASYREVTRAAVDAGNNPSRPLAPPPRQRRRRQQHCAGSGNHPGSRVRLKVQTQLGGAPVARQKLSLAQSPQRRRLPRE